MKKIELTLNGKKTVLNGPSDKAQEIIDFLTKLPTGEYYDLDGLATKFASSRRAVDQMTREWAEEFAGLMLGTPGRKKIYLGSKKSIDKLKEQLGIPK
jgi:hypothetical protein